jgi:lipoprotein-releasing system permease protein
VDITLLPVSSDGRVEKPDNRRLAIANEFSSGVYQVDSRRTLVGIGTAQRMLGLESGPIYDPKILEETGELVRIGDYPARTSMVLVRAAPGVTPEALRDAVLDAYIRFEARIRDDDGVIVKAPDVNFVAVRTWREQLRDILGPVEKERELMRILFSIVYLVCAGLVLSIFWAIVHEKTRDIGILRAVGASRPGILGVFLAYGLVVGLAGAVIGAVIGWLVTDNINAIHEGLGHPAPTWSWITAYVVAAALAGSGAWNARQGSMLRTLLSLVGTIVVAAVGTALLMHRGFLMWDPSVYYFNTIPSKVDWFSAVLTMAGAIVFSVLGAAIPAARAADTDPVRALRYE